MKKHLDLANYFLIIVQVVLLFTTHFMFIAESRIGAKVGLTPAEVFGSLYKWYVMLVVLQAGLVLLKRDNQWLNYLTALWSSLLIGIVVTAAGRYAAAVAASGDTSRVSLSIGAYASMIVSYLIIVKCNEQYTGSLKKMSVVLVSVSMIAAGFLLGKLDHLSIVIEYLNRKEQFFVELKNHVQISFSVVFWGTLIGVPLGWVAYNKKRLGEIIINLLNIVESLPALALISLLMFPLAFLNNHVPLANKLGITGIGLPPVFIALLCYSLYQIVNSTVGALEVVDRRLIEVARGMGMTPRQIFFKIELPLIFPVVISGIKVSLVSTILGVTIGAYAGFGGLGMFILQGVTGFAVDIVLLVTIPIMVMIFLSDACLEGLVKIVDKVRKSRGMVKL